MCDKEKVQGFSLKDKSACVVGCGGLGCNVSVHLAGAGIGRLLLCDFDTVSESNLNRQFLYRRSDIGKSKCGCAAEALRAYAPQTEIESRNIRVLSEDDLLFAKDCDIIISAVDNLPARQILQHFCRENGIPLVCAGIDGFYGTAYLYVPFKSPCPDCAGQNGDIKAKYNVSATAGIIGSLQAALAVRYLISEDALIAGRLHIYDGDCLETLTVKSSENCKECKKNTATEVSL